MSLTAASAAVGHGELTGSQIHAAIVGKYVTDDHHWGHKYFPDGRVERLENERLKSARWSIKNDRLCLLQPERSAKSSRYATAWCVMGKSCNTWMTATMWYSVAWRSHAEAVVRSGGAFHAYIFL
jgi:hypothetical protein